ncbi:hypothetical protein I5535_15870 [Rhodobacteraceae bacterium F11138]|nr:hypothetical protein [Rhodobacteraceae bacterium F11138]
MTFIGPSGRAQAQAYPIDCAILLCLSGGWPASAPCAQARAEFIRRITPWPVEPPLQIWRCPMGASYQGNDGESTGGPVYDILFDDPHHTPLPQSNSKVRFQDADLSIPAVHRGNGIRTGQGPHGLALQLVQDRADIDISGPEFNFVRSIRVYDVRYARQYEAARDGVCKRGGVVVLGTYGTQGAFSWQSSSISALPQAHVGLEGWGENCPEISHRSVFVEWRDYSGNYDFEQVNY